MKNLVTLIDQTSAQMITGPGVLHHVIVTAGTATHVLIYDGLNASGRLMFDLKALSGVSFETNDYELPFETGLWAVVDAQTVYLGVVVRTSSTFTNPAGNAGQ